MSQRTFLAQEKRLEVADSKAGYVRLWQELERTRLAFEETLKRFCIRRILQSWLPDLATDDFIFDVCSWCEIGGYEELPAPAENPKPARRFLLALVRMVLQQVPDRKAVDAAYSEVFPQSTPIHLDKKGKQPIGEARSSSEGLEGKQAVKPARCEQDDLEPNDGSEMGQTMVNGCQMKGLEGKQAIGQTRSSLKEPEGKQAVEKEAGKSRDGKLSEHFALSEFERSDKARALKIDNRVPVRYVSSLETLCREVLEPLRQHVGKPIRISSGYRCPALNKAVGGVATSQHLTGEAADIHLDSIEEGREWFKWLMDNTNVDQLIWERSGSTRWIHVSCKSNPEENRHEVKRLTK